MSVRPRVSIITPTLGREAFLPLAHACVQSQTWPDVEWLVFDDSPQPSAYLNPRAARNLIYIYSQDSFAVGEKRNILIEQSKGDIIVHFDDDDFYAPHYVETLMGWLDEGADFVKLSAWYLHSRSLRRSGYWDCATGGPHHRWSRGGARFVAENTPPDEANLLGYGFSYAYRRAVWDAVGPFPAVNAMEDTPFAQAARERFRFMARPDQTGLCLHTLHEDSTSLCLPQQELSPERMDAVFGPAIRPYLAP